MWSNEVLQLYNLYKENEDIEDYVTMREEFLEENQSPSFDAVVASEVIEHVDNPQQFVDTCSKLVVDDDFSLLGYKGFVNIVTSFLALFLI